MRISNRLVSGVLAAGLASLAIASAATPAFAGEPDKAKATRVGDKICITSTPSGDAQVTGSILNRRKCKTVEQWKALGVEVEPRATAATEQRPKS